jgi:hypothetical protein
MRRLGSIVILATVLASCGSPVPSSSVSPGPTATAGSAPSPSASAVASSSPSLAAPLTPAPSQSSVRPSPAIGPRPPFEVGAMVVTVTDDLRVRSKPRVSSDSVKYEPVLSIGTDLSVLAGPVSSSSYWWYRVHIEDGLTLRNGITIGWVAAADHDGTRWIDWQGGDTDPVPEPDYPELPDPAVILVGTEDYVGSDGIAYTRYDLSVTNWSHYPAELFIAEPDLEPCGLNTGASRTWVEIVDVDTGEWIYGFCGLTDPEDLTGIWFAVARGTPPPSGVNVVLWDRLYDRYAASNPVTPAAFPASPTPRH